MGKIEWRWTKTITVIQFLDEMKRKLHTVGEELGKKQRAHRDTKRKKSVHIASERTEQVKRKIAKREKEEAKTRKNNKQD